MIGERVAGRFVIEARLGGGGMGWVWRGRDCKLDRVVALKQVRADIGRLPELKARAVREAQALARIDHPGIVRVHDVIDAPDGPWIVMDYVQGTLLGTLIQRAPLAESAVMRIGAQAIDALAAAHAEKVLHRDVKPDNILITASGSVVLVDFGIATIEGHDRITVLGHVVGTPDFIAPERIRGEPVGPAADLWSLGATLYTALEGHPPFRRSTEEATRFAILTAPPAPMTRAVRLKPALNRLLAKSPANRMTAEELARHLEGAARAGPAAHPRRPPRNPTPPPPVPSSQAPPSRPQANDGVPAGEDASGGRVTPLRARGAAGGGKGVAARRVRRTLAEAGEAERGSLILTLSPDEAAVLLAERWTLFTTAAVEEMCREAARSATILQMLLPSRAGWLLNQVRDPHLVARVVLEMGVHHRGLVLDQMHDRHSAAAIESMAAIDVRRTGLTVAAMHKDPASQALSRLPPATIAGLLAQTPPACRDSLVPLLPSGVREEVARRLARRG